MSGGTDAFQEWTSEVRSWEEIAHGCAVPRRAYPVDLTLVRHGQTTYNARHLVTGISDPPLTALGRQQSDELAKSLAGAFDAAFQSGLKRSRETLANAVFGRPVGHTLMDRRLAERSMGVLEGQVSRPLPAYDRGDLFWAPEGGEPYVSVTQRAGSFLLDLLDAAERSERSLRVIASSHVGTMRILSGIVEQIADPIDVITRQFANALPIQLGFQGLAWPAFLDRREVLP